MLILEQLRTLQEERLLTALETWDQARKQLEEAVTRAEAREREFREVSEDIKRRLDALDLVKSMAGELKGHAPAEQELPAAEAQPRLAAPPNEEIEPEQMTTAEAPPDASGLLKPGAPESHLIDFPVRSSWRPLFTSAQRSKAARLSILQ
ncbi:MAG TPA: hypothetical protein VHY84_20650 [Bryobacteraceae bacterium]|nr:hypothetical protein [Bryobacteraceae bacterium]